MGNEGACSRVMAVWGILPAAGAGSRMQPLAFSKELLPVAGRSDPDAERPRAVSEFLVERLIAGGASRLCFVIAPGKSDILEYYGGVVQHVPVCYVVQGAPAGLCDAVFHTAPLVPHGDHVLIGLPDTVWFPVDALRTLPPDRLGLLLFPVDHPELFDAVITDEQSQVSEVQVKQASPRSKWIWGAMGMPAGVFHALHDLWRERQRADEYLGSLINAYIAGRHPVTGVRTGRAYVDVGTLNGYRHAIQLLQQPDGADAAASPSAREPKPQLAASRAVSG